MLRQAIHEVGERRHACASGRAGRPWVIGRTCPGQLQQAASSGAKLCLEHMLFTLSCLHHFTGKGPLGKRGKRISPAAAAAGDDAGPIDR